MRRKKKRRKEVTGQGRETKKVTGKRKAQKGAALHSKLAEDRRKSLLTHQSRGKEGKAGGAVRDRAGTEVERFLPGLQKANRGNVMEGDHRTGKLLASLSSPIKGIGKGAGRRGYGESGEKRTFLVNRKKNQFPQPSKKEKR